MKTREDKIVKIAKALSDKTRVRILEEVASKRDVGLTCSCAEEISGLSQPTVSHHIKILVDAELLSAEKSGRRLIVSINKETLNEFESFISNSLLNTIQS
jgi:DNA-binding transcriptional ArsR family regulator